MYVSSLTTVTLINKANEAKVTHYVMSIMINRITHYPFECLSGTNIPNSKYTLPFSEKTTRPNNTYKLDLNPSEPHCFSPKVGAFIFLLIFHVF
jgi:hypothetical protein